jgi:two-component sensor histidine kinase
LSNIPVFPLGRARLPAAPSATPEGLALASVLSPPSHIAPDLALALVASSQAPLLLLDQNFTVVSASASFYSSFKLEPGTVEGHDLFSPGSGDWALPRLRSLLLAAIASDTEVGPYELEFARGSNRARFLVINAHKLRYGDGGDVRLLVTITDVTQLRANEASARQVLQEKDDLVRQKIVLVQEIQHRVANSLQIIASLLMQSARKVQSQETRSHLEAAHHRLLSVAAVQRQLAISGIEQVALRPYFAQLCNSLAASMIFDPDLVRLEVTSDDRWVNADISVSLGLLVTELVINALKHAFPDGRAGKIEVDYQSGGPDWKLSVGDDGVGMGEVSPPPGLGTSIVQALASHLEATVVVEKGHPGTLVSIVHEDANAPPAPPAA